MVHYSRKFLNEGEGIALVETNIRELDFAAGLDVNCTIADFGKVVHVDFSIWDEASVGTSLTKLETLISELVGLQKALAKAAATLDFTPKEPR